MTPTIYATEWRPLAVTWLSVTTGIVALGWAALPPGPLVENVACAALASAATLGLSDPARPLLRSSPTSARRRLTYRFGVLTPALVASALLTGTLAAVSLQADGFGAAFVPRSMAFFALAVGTTTLLSRGGRSNPATVGATVPLAIVAAAHLATAATFDPASWLLTHPTLAFGVGLAMATIGTSGRDA